MSAYLEHVWVTVTALLPVLLAVALLVLVALILDAKRGEW